MPEDEQNNLAPWDNEVVEEVHDEVVNQEQQEEEKPDVVETPAVEPAKKEWTPEDIAKAYDQIQEQKALKAQPKPAEKPTLTEEEFNLKYRPKRYTEQDIAAEMDWDPDMDAKKIKGFTNLLNNAVDQSYQKAFQSADLVAQQEIEKLRQHYNPIAEKVQQYERQQVYNTIGTKLANKYPALARVCYREIVAKVSQPVFERHAQTPVDQIDRVVDDLAAEATKILKVIQADFDPTKQPISQTNKTPAKPQQNKPASLSTGGQSGTVPRATEQAKPKFNLFDTIS